MNFSKNKNDIIFRTTSTFLCKRGVALTGRNTTDPPRAASGELRCICECYRRRRQTTDASDRY